MTFRRASAIAVAVLAVGGYLVGRHMNAPALSASSMPWGHLPDGAEVPLFRLVNSHGMVATVSTYGGTVVSLLVPDGRGRVHDVVLGYDSLAPYLRRSPYFGAIVGRYANRIGGARFTLDGQAYTLAENDHGHSLHGGSAGFDKVVWSGRLVGDSASVGARLHYLSTDGEEGYPGNLDVTVTYSLTEANELRIDYRSTTDKPTVLNLSHHGYFNLAGPGSGDVLGHELTIAADRFTPVDSMLIPTGEVRSVSGTPLDFRSPATIGARIGQADAQLRFGGGYDHNWVLNGESGTLRLAARVREPRSGRVMEVFTTEPGLQFYSGNFLDGSHVGKGGVAYGHRTGFCLETQHFPDSPNHPEFPSTVLRPGQEYSSTTVYRFSAR